MGASQSDWWGCWLVSCPPSVYWAASTPFGCVSSLWLMLVFSDKQALDLFTPLQGSDLAFLASSVWVVVGWSWALHLGLQLMRGTDWFSRSHLISRSSLFWRGAGDLQASFLSWGQRSVSRRTTGHLPALSCTCFAIHNYKFPICDLCVGYYKYICKYIILHL